MNQKCILFTVALGLFFAFCSHAAEYRLFDSSGNPSPDYDTVVAGGKLKEGDLLRFSNGKKFAIEKVLGNGNLNVVLDVGGGKVIRIPKMHYFRHMLPLYLQGSQALDAEGVPKPRVFSDESLDTEYLVVEKMDVQFTLDKLIQHPGNFAPELKQKAYAALIDFGKKTANFSHLGDFKMEQLAWVGAHWVLLDWDQEHALAKSLTSRTAFDGAGLPRKLLKDVRAAIFAERSAKCPLISLKQIIRPSRTKSL